jgi:aspartate kinase
MTMSSLNALTVIKIGGSVLTGAAAYRRAARFLEQQLALRPGGKILAIVSAERGLTDALLTAARELAADPDQEALDLLWSTGELRSVALLVLALQNIGIRAAGANIHQTGLVSRRGLRAAQPSRSGVRPLRLRSLLSTADVVVAPGFLARTEGDSVASLGRGGSDLSAVLLAAGLGAERCELLKDVPGYFNTDPNANPDAEHIGALAYADAIRMAADGCDLVQLNALETARELNVRLLIRAMDQGLTTTVS